MYNKDIVDITTPSMFLWEGDGLWLSDSCVIKETELRPLTTIVKKIWFRKSQI